MIHDGNIQLVSLRMVKEPSAIYQPEPLTNAREASRIFRQLMADMDRECVWLACLDNKNKVIAFSLISLGTLDGSFMHPREVFKTALLANSARIMLVHNHPSGDPAPSSADRLVTKRIHDAGLIMGIELLDHIIIGDDDRFYSFKDDGELS